MKHQTRFSIYLFMAATLALTACATANSPAALLTPAAEKTGVPAAVTTQPSAAQPDASEMPPTLTVAAPNTSQTMPAAQADCKKIAFDSYNSSPNNTEADIYTICPNGSGLTQLTQKTGYNIDPAWSADGKKIAFSSTRSGSAQIYWMNPDGSGPQAITSDQNNNHPIWLPGGSELAFATTDSKGLWWWRTVKIDGSAIRNLTPPSSDWFFQTQAWSPDGKKIAFMLPAEQQGSSSTSSQIHIKNSDGSNDISLTPDTWMNLSPVWSQDGSRLAFLTDRDGTPTKFGLYAIQADGTKPVKLTDAIFPENTSFSWSPDDQQIAINDRDGKMIRIVDNQGNPVMKLGINTGESVFKISWQP